MNKNNFSKYNDGVAFLYNEKTKRTNFGAKQNVSTLDDLEFIAKLDFEQSSKRQQDIEFAEQQGFSLSLKIKTRYRPNISNKCKAVINNYLYDVQFVDDDRKEMWLYMEEVRKLEE